MRLMGVRWFVVATLVMLAACSESQADGAASDVTSTSSDISTSTTVTTSPPETIPANVSVALDESVVSAVVAQAADELGIEADGLEPVIALWATWNDGSLNCPEEGEQYTQAIVEGQWIVLTDGSLVYDYRSGSDGEFRYCAAGRPPTSSRAEP